MNKVLPYMKTVVAILGAVIGPIPHRYDLGEIGFASFFARAGFKRLQPLPGSRWGLRPPSTSARS